MQALRPLLLIPLLPVLLVLLVADFFGALGSTDLRFTRSLLDAVLGTTES